MLCKAVATGDERESWRRFRGGEAQCKFFDGYVDGKLEDPLLLPGFTAVLSAAVQNRIGISVLATLTLAEVQVGAGGDVLETAAAL